MQHYALVLVSALLAQSLCAGCGGGSDPDEPLVERDAGTADAATERDADSPARDASSPARDADSPARDASSDAAPAPEPEPVPALGTCKFTVDGAPYQSAAGDVFTTALLADGSLSVQCVAVAGTQRLTINLAVNGVTAPGMYGNALAQLSEQPAEGGSATQYRTFTANLVVQELSATAVAGSCSFAAAGTAATKNVTVSFNLPHR